MLNNVLIFSPNAANLDRTVASALANRQTGQRTRFRDISKGFWQHCRLVHHVADAGGRNRKDQIVVLPLPRVGKRNWRGVAAGAGSLTGPTNSPTATKSAQSIAARRWAGY